MGPSLLFALQLTSLFTIVWSNVHDAHSHILSPEPAVGVSKIHTQVKVNEPLAMPYDHQTNHPTSRNGYPKGEMGDPNFWQVMDTQCHHWKSWAKNIFRSLVREMNSTTFKSLLHEVLHTCEADEDTGVFQHPSRYLFNGEDMLYYHGRLKRWLNSHPEAAAVVEAWNQELDKAISLDTGTTQGSRVQVHQTAPFATRKMDRPVVTVYSREGNEGQRYLICHVADFYPRAIEVTWEWKGQAVNEERVTRGEILPNADHTFQTRLQILLEEPGASPDGYECVVQHVSLGEMPLRARLGFEQWKLVLLALIVIFPTLGIVGPAILISHFQNQKNTQGTEEEILTPSSPS